VGGGERLRGGGRLGGDTGEETLGCLGEMDADLAELFGLQGDAGLGEALAGGELDGAVECLDGLLQTDAVLEQRRLWIATGSGRGLRGAGARGELDRFAGAQGALSGFGNPKPVVRGAAARQMSGRLPTGLMCAGL
jgi:hypothetical protein